MICVRNYSAAHSMMINALSVRPKSTTEFATGSMDQYITLWDDNVDKPVLGKRNAVFFVNICPIYTTYVTKISDIRFIHNSYSIMSEKHNLIGAKWNKMCFEINLNRTYLADHEKMDRWVKLFDLQIRWSLWNCLICYRFVEKWLLHPLFVMVGREPPSSRRWSRSFTFVRCKKFRNWYQNNRIPSCSAQVGCTSRVSILDTLVLYS